MTQRLKSAIIDTATIVDLSNPETFKIYVDAEYMRMFKDHQTEILNSSQEGEKVGLAILHLLELNFLN